MTTELPKRRRWFQFRLRTLFIAILVLSLPLSWFAVRLERARRQRNALEKTEGLGASCYYDWQGDPYAPGDPSPQEPQWMISLLGGDFFWDITTFIWKPDVSDPRQTSKILALLREFPKLKDVYLHGRSVTDDEIVHLEDAKELRKLALFGTAITDHGLQHISQMTSLEELILDGCNQITRDGFVFLEAMDGVQYLDLTDTNMDDAAMKHLERLNLRHLILPGPDISDEGVAFLKGQEDLRWLSIYDTSVTDQGLLHLTGLGRLAVLNLNGTSITDEGLRQISEIDSLSALMLSGTRITDKGLECLFGLDLELIQLGGGTFGNVTPEGVQRLREAMPECGVRYP